MPLQLEQVSRDQPGAIALRKRSAVDRHRDRRGSVSIIDDDLVVQHVQLAEIHIRRAEHVDDLPARAAHRLAIEISSQRDFGGRGLIEERGRQAAQLDIDAHPAQVGMQAGSGPIAERAVPASDAAVG